MKSYQKKLVNSEKFINRFHSNGWFLVVQPFHWNSKILRELKTTILNEDNPIKIHFFKNKILSGKLNEVFRRAPSANGHDYNSTIPFQSNLKTQTDYWNDQRSIRSVLQGPSLLCFISWNSIPTSMTQLIEIADKIHSKFPQKFSNELMALEIIEPEKRTHNSFQAHNNYSLDSIIVTDNENYENNLLNKIAPYGYNSYAYEDFKLLKESLASGEPNNIIGLVSRLKSCLIF